MLGVTSYLSGFEVPVCFVPDFQLILKFLYVLVDAVDLSRHFFDLTETLVVPL